MEHVSSAHDSVILQGERTPEMQHHPNGPATTSAGGSSGDSTVFIRLKDGEVSLVAMPLESIMLPF